MKVCMFIYYYWPVEAGGTESQCRKLVRQLTRLGIDCFILTGRHKIENAACERDEGATIIRTATFEAFLQKIKLFLNHNRSGDSNTALSKNTIEINGFRYHSRFCFALMSKVASWGLRYLNALCFSVGACLYLIKHRHSISLIHVHTADWISGFASWIGNRLHIPVLCKGADLPVFPELHGLPFAFLWNRWRTKPFFIALTRAMRDDLIRNGVVAEKITVIPNGVELPNTTVSAGENTVFLYMGNFSQTSAHKGFDILIDAWAKVHSQEPSASLIMLGGGDAGPWKQYAKRMGCGNSIQFAGYKKNVTPYFRQACCFLLTSRKEGISNALLEAQSYGIPAVVSDIPGSREVVSHSQTGLVVPVDDAKALADAVLRLYRNPSLRHKYGRAARIQIEEKFAIQKVVKKIINLYTQLLSET